MFRHFNIRDFEISKYWSFYILSFQILTPTRRVAHILADSVRACTKLHCDYQRILGWIPRST